MRSRPFLLIPAFALMALAVPADAWAQRYSGGRPGQMLGGAPGSIDRSNRPPPTALPGLAARGAVEPIPADPNQNLAPTPALFDAINRGDLYTARDAVARGADTEARNALGLTPLDAAVDQGRNEIMFFLLSVRGSRTSAPPPETRVFAGPPPSPAAQRAQRAREARERDRNDGTTVTMAAPRELPPQPAAAPSGPRLWAGDGGAPKPEIGFLGFDAGRPAGVAPPPGAVPAAPRPRPTAERPGRRPA